MLHLEPSGYSIIVVLSLGIFKKIPYFLKTENESDVVEEHDL